MMFQKVVNRNVRGKMTIPDLSSAPIVGLPLLGRDDRALGYIFDLTSFCFRDCKSPVFSEFAAGSVCEKCTMARLSRISSALFAARRSATMSFDDEESDANRLVVLKIEVGQLSKSDVLRQLKYCSERLQSLGFVVSVVFSESSLVELNTLREFGACSYAMEDAGITVLLAGSPNRKLTAGCRSVLEQSISGLMVTPALLGLGTHRGVFDSRAFEAAMAWLGKVVHEHRKMIVVDDVRTAWQLDVIRSMPFYAFSGSVSGSLVFV